MRLSGLQREVLKLYRQCLREARKKPEVFVEPDVGECRTNTTYIGYEEQLPVVCEVFPLISFALSLLSFVQARISEE